MCRRGWPWVVFCHWPAGRKLAQGGRTADQTALRAIQTGQKEPIRAGSGPGWPPADVLSFTPASAARSCGDDETEASRGLPTACPGQGGAHARGTWASPRAGLNPNAATFRACGERDVTRPQRV